MTTTTKTTRRPRVLPAVVPDVQQVVAKAIEVAEPMLIEIYYCSIDDFHQTRKFKTLSGARKYAQMRIGPHPEFGTGYAVSDDGIGTVSVKGCKLRDLFPLDETPKAPRPGKGSPERLAAGRKAADTRKANLAVAKPAAKKKAQTSRHVAALRAHRTRVEQKVKGSRGKTRKALIDKLASYDELIAQAA
jgi:hypothetical protein